MTELNTPKILEQTSAMKHGNNPASNKPKSSGGLKYKTIIKPIWENLYGYIGKGKGLKSTNGSIVIPSDPHALSDRLEILLASHEAGNTGVRNEIISICDELLRQGEMKKSDYKKLMLLI